MRGKDKLGRYSVSLALIGCGWIAHEVIFPTQTDAAFEIFLIPITLTAMIAGLGPAILSVSLATLLAWYFFLPPALSVNLDRNGALALLIFVASALLIACAVSLGRIRPSPT
jgi:K+-sensing histidine kinase KdpD